MTVRSSAINIRGIRGRFCHVRMCKNRCRCSLRRGVVSILLVPSMIIASRSKRCDGNCIPVACSCYRSRVVVIVHVVFFVRTKWCDQRSWIIGCCCACAVIHGYGPFTTCNLWRRSGRRGCLRTPVVQEIFVALTVYGCGTLSSFVLVSLSYTNECNKTC